MHQFKAESKKLLDLMINSIYTNREIFLRELISNASDACDKRYFKSLTDTSIGITKDDLKIHIQPDKDSRTLTITDNGIGMTKEELEANLGTIARSGSLQFKEGLESGFAVTNRELLSLTEAPRRLVVIGGGVIGLEMAAYFNSIGSEITVIEMLDHIAGENDRELVGILQKHYENRGMKLLLSAKVTEIADGAVRYEKDGKSGAVECDKALISIGRRPNIKDVGLESIGVLTERGAIVTDSRMRTNQPEVYAAGDVNGRSMLAHTAYREAEVAVNTMLGKRDNMRYDAIPAVLYTNPELSGVGYTEAAAAAAGLDARTVTLPMRYSGRYVAENEGGDGIFKLVVNNRDNTILGAQALCNYSSEFIIAAASFIEQRLTLDDIKEIVFPHPTVSEIIREAVFQA